MTTVKQILKQHGFTRVPDPDESWLTLYYYHRDKDITADIFQDGNNIYSIKVYKGNPYTSIFNYNNMIFVSKFRDARRHRKEELEEFELNIKKIV
jgi:hypothetical protein